jgi:hypothetical protein
MDKDAYILELQAENSKLKELIIKLEAKIVDLEARLNINSKNSGMPPSSDKFSNRFKKKVNLREKSDNSSGGVIGHEGNTLKMKPMEEVTQVSEIDIEVCPVCSSRDLIEVDGEVDKK